MASMIGNLSSPACRSVNVMFNPNSEEEEITVMDIIHDVSKNNLLLQLYKPLRIYHVHTELYVISFSKLRRLYDEVMQYDWGG